MKRKTAVKQRRSEAAPKGKANGSNGAKGKKTPTRRERNYLDPNFTRRLVEHMHRAKKAALEDKE